ncbi:hypothetical protein IMG5_024570 [Ichthyophthirius multifiliis]|uniref:SGS domain-containing protein n=1 Tax=Ichthyophthirius multifiliis TaxID=5932 RepID=G0QL30_ICHMU|nr:hypothetical protein IMG5_024570 [Ichthyophthirius multifiliis]EGR34086.1 hypothetical protein IMG5_024570 [Ichthyophthirius multifiliis]|eukprot:XP_004039390.1 hypothetical protein IMG5_024570 [Ichthyophthirius multifiliis]
MELKEYDLDIQELKQLLEKAQRQSVRELLIKENSGNWAQLQYKESTFKKPKENELDSGDPQASLMKLMKEMYENGDDEMKKTIAKTWTEQQNKKGQAL